MYILSLDATDLFDGCRIDGREGGLNLWTDSGGNHGKYVLTPNLCVYFVVGCY